MIIIGAFQLEIFSNSSWLVSVAFPQYMKIVWVCSKYERGLNKIELLDHRIKCLVKCFLPSKSSYWLGILLFPSRTDFHHIGDGRKNNCLVSQYSKIIFALFNFFLILVGFFQSKALQRNFQSCGELIEQLSCCHWLRKQCPGAGSGFQLPIWEQTQPLPRGIKTI